SRLKARFETEIFPIVTPLAVDPGHPFPFLKNCSLNLAVHLVPANNPDVGSYPLLAVLQVPSQLPRFLPVDPPEGQAFVLIEDLITHHVGQLFHGMRIEQCVPFRVVRNWDLTINSDEQEDLLATVQKELQNRWRNDAVHMEIDASAHPQLTERLTQALGLTAGEVQHHRGPVGLADFLMLVESSGSKGRIRGASDERWRDEHGPLGAIGRSDLRDKLFQPMPSPAFPDDVSVFDSIADKDVLLHHPYEAYDPVLRLLKAASTDPRVLAIKQTLYRVKRDSPILEYLSQAAENGKQTTALVELKARFDEETNVEWAHALESAGVHVVYGLARYKTHCKV
ncbi:MAG: RNA degradosome polyphosphate kinase, partial [Myxococcota bacterium]